MKHKLIVILLLPLMMLSGCEKHDTEDCIHAYGVLQDLSAFADCCDEVTLRIDEVVSDPNGEIQADTLHCLPVNLPDRYRKIPDKYKVEGMKVEVFVKNPRPGGTCGFGSYAAVDIIQIKKL